MAIETIAAFIERSGVEKEITWPGPGRQSVLRRQPAEDRGPPRQRARVPGRDNREELTGWAPRWSPRWSPADDDDRLGGRQPLLPRRGGELRQLTRRLVVSAALGEGILNSDDVEHHPLRNVITKAVGRDTMTWTSSNTSSSRATSCCCARTAARHDQRPGDQPHPGRSDAPLETRACADRGSQRGRWPRQRDGGAAAPAGVSGASAGGFP